MRTTKLYSIGLIAMMIFTCSQQTFAQDYSFYNQMFSNMLSNRIWDSIYEQSSPGYSDAKKRLRNSKSKSSSQSSPYEVPAYRKYPAVQFKSIGTRLMLQELTDAYGKTPQDKADWKELMSGILDKYDAAARAKGYPNDLALAYVSFVALNSLVYNGMTERPIIPFEQNIGLRDVAAEHAAEHGIFNKYTDREKQAFYELLVIYGAVTYHLYEKALKEMNAEKIKNAKLVAAQNLELAGIKP